MTAFDEFIGGSNEITLSKGEVVSVPPLTWGKELKIYKIITKILSQSSVSLDSEGNPQFDDSGVLNFMGNFATDITDIATIVLTKDKKWVEANLTSKDIVEFIVPLSLHVFGKLGKGLTDAVDKLTAELTGE